MDNMIKALDILAFKAGFVSEDFNAFYVQAKDLSRDFVYKPKTSTPLPTTDYHESVETYRGDIVSFRPLVEIAQDYQPVLYIVEDDYVEKPWVRIANLGIYFSIYYSFEANDEIPVFVYHSGSAGISEDISRIKLADSLESFRDQLVGVN